MEQMDTLPMAPHLLTLAGTTVEITPLRVGELPQFLAAVQPIASAKAAAAKPVAVVAHRSSARAQSSSQQRGQAARQQLSDDA